ncbi:DUF3567 domain-containing protein [Piscinibacter sakaiensis]|uniref:BTH_I0359 family protein n=1 Tax=Piscinibacter sakaiensis TaxID=1547922 RepID=UPI003AAA5ECA
MHMLYNSDNFVVVQFDAAASGDAPANTSPSSRGGYEIVDKFARKEIFISGDMAQSFKAGVDALIETGPSEDEMDDYIARYTSLMQQPVVLH